MDLYLKFADEAEAQSVLYTKVVTEWTEPENPEDQPQPVEWYFKPNYQNIDTVGVIYHDDAVVDADGNVVTPATPMDGWHVNVRVVGEDATPLEAYKVAVNTPMRVWG